jgi:Tfp pilus assembly protein PilN
MRAVNLLPKDEARTRRGMPSPWVLLAATVPVVAGSLVYLGYSSEHSTVADKQAQLAVVQARLASLSSLHGGAASQATLLTLKGQRSLAIQDALSKQMPWDVTLEDLAHVLPKGVSLLTMSAASPTPSAAASTGLPPVAPAAGSAPMTFSITGNAQNHDQVAELLERLSLLPMLTNVTLGSTSTVAGTSPAAAASAALGGSGTPAAKPAKPVKPTLQFSLTAGIQQPPKAVDQ